jgi:hypothetical protein
MERQHSHICTYAQPWELEQIWQAVRVLLVHRMHPATSRSFIPSRTDILKTTMTSNMQRSARSSKVYNLYRGCPYLIPKYRDDSTIRGPASSVVG